MPKANPSAELAQKLLHALEQRRQAGSDYPLTVARLAALADPVATPEQVHKALAKKPFAERWLIARKKDVNSPIALVEDAERLAASPLLLEFVLAPLCSAAKPLHALKTIVNKVDKALRPAFQAALERLAAENTLPPTVGTATVRNKLHLYLRQFPPAKKPAEELSEKLVQVLTEQRGTDAYPPPLNRLIEQTGIAATPLVVKQALRREPFRSQAIVLVPSQPDGLVALASDTEHLPSSPLLLRSALTKARTANNQAVSVADMTKKIIKVLQDPFSDAVNRQLSARTLPDGIGMLRIKKKPLLFLLEDISANPPSLPLSAIRSSQQRTADSGQRTADFARRFEEAFERLDRERGSHNHVSLVALRQALPVERARFDAELQQLRRAGRYSLSAAEGRHGISPQEQEAGIREDGSLLLFVSRKTP